jgi:predicted dehydrogenase
MISMLMTNPVSGLLRGTSNQPTHGTPYMHPRADTYSDPRISGGGQMYAQVCHAAAYLTYLTGARATEVFAQLHNDGAAVDIYDAILLRMNDSSVVTIASTGATSLTRKDFEVRIFGTAGMLFLDLWNGHMEHILLQGKQRTYPDLSAESIYPHQAPVNNLIDSIFHPERNLSPAILGVAAMEVIEAASRSAQANKNILVSSLYGSQHA